MVTAYPHIAIMRVTNRSPAFYPLMGPFLARREVDDELGVPLWDDDDRTWWIAVHQDEVVGFAAAVAGPDVVRFGAAWVRPGMRRRGIHRQLLGARLAAYPDQRIVATCTPGSVSNFLAAGFVATHPDGDCLAVHVHTAPEAGSDG